MMKSLLLALTIGIALASTPASADLSDFLVEDWCASIGASPCPSWLDTVITWEKRDFGGLRGPAEGYLASHSVRYYQTPDYLVPLQTWTFTPFRGFTPTSGDGGQLLYSDASRAIAVETRDGGTPGNQYFSPSGCGDDGWLFFRHDAIQVGRWTDATVRLVNVPEPSGHCPRASLAYTRWRLESAKVLFNWGGLYWRDIWVVISEHFGGGSITGATDMERGVFCQGFGWCGWQAWTTNLNASVGNDLLSRCPPIYIKGGGPWPLAEPSPGWIMTDCRQWTNIQWAGDGHTTVRAISWPP